MSCEEDMTTAGTIAVIASGVPQRGFKEALAEVSRHGRPMILDAAEAVMTELGGAVELGKMIAQDLRKVRGDHLDEELRQFHDTDFKVLKGMYDLISKMLIDRDKLVGESGDPLADVSEEDLMAIASQAALLQVEVDGEFRKKIIEAILRHDPELIVSTAVEALDILASGPRVEVIDVSDAVS